MKAISAFLVILLTFAIAGCGGGGDSAPPPPDVKVAVGDTSATVTWTQESGTEYWVWVAQGTAVSTSNCAQTIGCKIYVNVGSPFVIAGLVNGTTYSVTVNARTGGGPGGSGTDPISFVPRIAGTTWTAGAPLGQMDLRGLGFTAATTAAVPTAVTVGTGGAIFFSTEGVNWTAATSNVTTNLNAAAYTTSHFLAVGDGGTILTSIDGITWSAQASHTTANLFGVTSNGSGTSVVVGAGGTIVVSTDNATWAPANSQTTADLYGVTFANGKYVAVGAGGVILTSPDAGTWTAITPVTSAALRSASFGSFVPTGITTATSTWVVVGDGGSLLTSADGVTWVPQLPITASNLASVAHGTQFVAVGAGGTIYTSIDGISWQPASSGVTQDLNAVAFTVLTGGSVGVGYMAVGDNGTNLTSF